MLPLFNAYSSQSSEFILFLFHLATCSCIFDVAIQSRISHFLLFHIVCNALFLDMKCNETNNTSQCQHGLKCVHCSAIENSLFVTVRFHRGIFDVDDVVSVVVVVLHTILFVDKCEMLKSLTLKWIQIYGIMCCYSNDFDAV